MPPGTLEIERELVPAVGYKDIPPSQSNRFAATEDSSFAFKMHTGGMHVTARAADVRTCVRRTDAHPGDLRHSEVSDDSRLDRAVQRQFAG